MKKANAAPKDFHWLKSSPVTNTPNPNQPTVVPVVKEEPEDQDETDSFKDFPLGAIQYTREELFDRMRARAQGQDVNQVQVETDSEDSFDEFVVPEAVEPVQAAPSEPQADPALLAAISHFMTAPGDRRLVIQVKDQKATLIVTPEKEEGTSTPLPLPDSQDSGVKPKRRLRVVDPSDDEEEEELVDTEPEDFPDEEENVQVTPKKKTKPPVLVTPSPAKRLRTLDLNPRDSSSDEGEQEEEEDKEEDGIDDSDAETNPFVDSQMDPEWIPDTQEQRDRPSDFRVPKNAAKDPLDLDY